MVVHGSKLCKQSVFIFTLLLTPYLVSSRVVRLCDENLRTKVTETEGLVHHDGSLATKDGVIYPSGTYWHEGEFWWACPCLLGNCIRLCQRVTADIAHVPMAPLPIYIPVWDGDVEKTVSISSFFNVVYESKCKYNGFYWDDGLTYSDFRIQKDGSIYSPSQMKPFTKKYTDTSNFCLMPHENRRFLNVLFCDPIINWMAIVFPLFFVVSAIFLLLTILAYILTQNHNSVDDRTVVCLSGVLLIAYIGLTVKYLTGEASHITACVIMAYVEYIFELAAFFWLNVMCINLFIKTNKSSVCTRDHFCKFAIYASGVPLALFLITLIVDRTTSHSTLSPGIGVESCWFRTFWGSFLYINGPILFLLIANIVLLIAIEMRFRRQQSGSMRQKQQERETSSLIIKLLLLMGFTWFFEIVSWADGSSFAIWYITDSISALRGVFIFWICVISNVAVWEPLKEKYWQKQKEIDDGTVEVPMTTIDTSISDTHM